MTARRGIAWFEHLLAVLVCVTVLADTGCRRREQPPPAVEPALMAFLSRARAAHHRADLLEDRLELDRALGELRLVVGGPMTERSADFAEIREVLADTRARMADLESRLGRYDQAERQVAQGLELAPEPTYFRGHLLETRGLIEERRARDFGRRARELLEQADTRLPAGSPDAQRRDELVAKLGRVADAASPKPDQAVERSERAWQRELDELRRAGLNAEERRTETELSAQAEAARQRALDAFEQSMALQAEVIRSATRPNRER